MKSTKSASASKSQAPKRDTWWRLDRTLARKPWFRPVERDDLKYAYAAYKLGGFGSQIEPGLDAAGFTAAFEAGPDVAYHAIWTLLERKLNGSGDPKPIGMIFAFFAHPEPILAPYVIIDTTEWFAWATPRQRVEGAVNFFNQIRSELPVMGYADRSDKAFFEMICKHGILRRVGTSHLLDKAVFESRMK